MTRLYDRQFASAFGLNSIGQVPIHVVWRCDGPPGKTAWFTDSFLYEALRVDAEVKVAWIWEAPSTRTDPYDFVESHPGLFDWTVAYDWKWHAGQANHIVCPATGTRLYPKDRRIHEKNRMVSIIASPKRGRFGYDLRHMLIKRTKETGCLDSYGPEYGVLPDGYKLSALAPYRFTVIIPSDYSVANDAITDAFLTGTVPIYWGMPWLGRDYDTRGAIDCINLWRLESTVTSLKIEDYESRIPYIEDNFSRAQKLACAEDWLFERYPFLFDEG